MKQIGLTFLVVTNLLVGACAASSNIDLESGTKLNFPLAKYTNLLMVGDHLTAFAVDVLSPSPNLILYARQNDPKTRLLELRQDTQCRNKATYWGLQALPDGRLGMIKNCFGGAQTAGNTLGIYQYMMAYDWHNYRLDYIVDGPLLDPLSVGRFTWNPTMTKGVQEKFSVGKGTIFLDKSRRGESYGY